MQVLSPIQATEAYLKNTRAWQKLHFQNDDTPVIQVATAVVLESLVGLGISATLYVEDHTDASGPPGEQRANVSIGHIPSVFSAAGMTFADDTKKPRNAALKRDPPYDGLDFPWCMLDANSPTRLAMLEYLINQHLPLLGWRWVSTKWTEDTRKVKFLGPNDQEIRGFKVGNLLRPS
jgi:hypothetical protein